jgi:hypothetical protein
MRPAEQIEILISSEPGLPGSENGLEFALTVPRRGDAVLAGPCFWAAAAHYEADAERAAHE